MISGMSGRQNYDNGPGGGGRSTFNARLSRAMVEYVMWTRESILYTVSGLLGRPEVYDRYREAPDDIAQAFAEKYDKSVADKVGKLFFERITTIIDMARAYTGENMELYRTSNDRLDRNNNSLVTYLSSINPAYNMRDLKLYFDNDEDNVVTQIRSVFGGETKEALKSYEDQYHNILDLSDFLAF